MSDGGIRVKFWGAARTVTGSCHLLMTGGKNVLLDCGLFQGRRQLSRKLNREFVLRPSALDAVVLSHTHVDHCGNIPNLVKNGFSGPIHCTAATADMAALLMRDSGHIQEQDAKYLNRKAARRGDPEVEPLYTVEDAERTDPLMRAHPYNKPIPILENHLSVRFRDAGHVLGSAFVELSARANGKETRLLFSGDLGRKNMPILRDPEVPEPADYLVLESTYGDRLHQDYIEAEHKLEAAVARVVARGGKIVVPAFSVGRTQELVYALNRLWNQGRLPRIPVYVDSPLSINATQVFRKHPECYDADVLRDMLTDPDPFGFEGLIYTRTREQSMRINLVPGPCIIISASGMAESGRVLHHLKNTIRDPRNAVFIVGFQAQNTLGRKLVEKQPEVKIFGEPHDLAAEVVTFNAFSAHGDQKELTDFALSAAQGGRLKKIFLVHGEETVMANFQQHLSELLPGVEVVMPERGQVFDLG